MTETIYIYGKKNAGYYTTWDKRKMKAKAELSGTQKMMFMTEVAGICSIAQLGTEA